jgi:hypothetical protein
MANPTTNYGFVLPTTTDLVTDLPADFDVALQGVDTRLKALQPGTTLGDVVYSSATANTNTRLGIGSNGQVLSIAAGVPAWATPASGAIKQLVSNNSTTSQALSTTTYTDVTGASVTITPASASNNVQISITFPVEIQRQTNALLGYSVQLLRGATVLDEWENIVMLNAGVAANAFIQSTGMVAINYKDSPATTSATTYKLQAKLSTTGNLANSFIPGSNGTLNISAMEF